jgi:Holliday junction resolvasome RuvABC endonuclease subunit
MSESDDPRILGLDLSITATGVCLPTGTTVTIKTRTSDKDLRLVVIRDYLRMVIRDAVIDYAVIEDLPTHAYGAGITGMVHGTVRAELMNLGIPYALVTPATLKKYATGRGNANKSAMILSAWQRARVEFRDDNQCDAFWLWQAGMDHFNAIDVAAVMPKANRTALSVVEWPKPRKRPEGSLSSRIGLLTDGTEIFSRPGF